MKTKVSSYSFNSKQAMCNDLERVITEHPLQYAPALVATTGSGDRFVFNV